MVEDVRSLNEEEGRSTAAETGALETNGMPRGATFLWKTNYEVIKSAVKYVK